MTDPRHRRTFGLPAPWEPGCDADVYPPGERQLQNSPECTGTPDDRGREASGGEICAECARLGGWEVSE